MSESVTVVGKHFALSFDGFSALSLMPAVDYRRYLSSVGELTQKSWNMTANAMRMALDNFGEKHGRVD